MIATTTAGRPQGRERVRTPRTGLALLLAGIACLLPACPSEIESIREKDAETVFVRGVSIPYVERETLDGVIGDVAFFPREKPKIVTGVGLVVGLEGTGDTGEAFAKTETFAEGAGDLRLPERARIAAGETALAMVEAPLALDLGEAAGLAGASLRPLGNAKSLEGGMLLETTLVDPGTGEVYALAAGPVLVRRVDAGGEELLTPTFGRVHKVIVRSNRPPRRERTLKVRPAWPELLEALAASIRGKFETIEVTVEPPDTLEILLPDLPFSLPADIETAILTLPFSAGSGGLPRVLCFPGAKGFVAVGRRLFLGRGTFLLGGGLKVISLAPRGALVPPRPAATEGEETDLALVEVEREGAARRIITLRWLGQVVRVLDRLGTPYERVRRLMEVAVEAGAMAADLVELPPGREKILKVSGSEVR